VGQPDVPDVPDVPATVLVVDDAPDVRLLARAVLTRAHFSVVEAAGGQEALAVLAQSAAPDLVVLDVQMPDVDGWDTLQAIRMSSDAAVAYLPVILCTVKAHPRDVRRAWQVGCDGYLNKPFSITDLIDAVRTVLARTAEERMAYRQEMATASAEQPAAQSGAGASR
jgi:CheY-like chemotaxis protein